MLKIALCDDETMELQILVELIKLWINNHADISVNMDCYTSVEQIIDAMEREKYYDIYILDVLMPEMTGIELGHLIRKKDRFPIIIYVTNSKEFALEAFANHPLHYLIKPVRKRAFFEVLDFAWSFINEKKANTITINTKTEIHVIRVSDIIYIENVSRRPRYHLRTGKSICGVINRGTFEAAIPDRIREGDFLSPHKSFFVNMDYISGIQEHELILDDGFRIPISRNRMTEVRHIYLKYIAQDGAGYNDGI